MKRYKWTNGARIKADAQKVGERLERLQKKAGQRLTPRIVVEDARPETSVLHPCFEWDDVRAAELYREAQARNVMHSVRIVMKAATDTEPAETLRAFVHVHEMVGDETQSVYVPIARVQAEPDLYRQVVEQAANELRAFERRYQEFDELATIGQEAADRAEQLLLSRASA